MKIAMVEQYVVRVNYQLGGWGQYGCPVSKPEDLDGVVSSLLRHSPEAEYFIERQVITTRSEVFEWTPTVG